MGQVIGFPRSQQHASSTEPAPEPAPEPLWREVVGRELREERHRQGRTLRPYETPDLAGVTKWLADNEVLDPENPEDLFEPMAGGGLFRRLRKPF